MTPERYQRIRNMLAKRQTDLTVCLENVHKPHNVSAVVRTCDAIGIHKVHAIWESRYGIRRGTAMGSERWVGVDTHQNVGDAIRALKANNMQVLVTHLSDEAVDFRAVDYTRPTAILFGQEKYGATDEAIALSDKEIVIPMVGMVQSLNVSVAAALVLYEAQRQRQNAGMYQIQQLTEAECQRILFEGGYPVLAKVCRSRDLPYPVIDDRGQIAADDAWWAKMDINTSAFKSLLNA
ncbi:tRNA (guanosine(18)-2'-O)-methyltransferase TrmH [Aestuariibacter sp. GS-14]|uniref:tRNA (guanosine(18)-2'-O)-methyltransferase TrmH n=1 Tax=Aestuariibacter sp. GS-14 TaxID=2590670 RepID=UPI001129E589|nr:tRNA (guanosine(18)-2'-O)-methyltransferase TrmH [Aestuariibacter sp. GS-14]TPV58564.1 tRNA (guanosine(18)-2'-O)-methyltransferase TrmH [Aestuariibacter sp. GS-14]